MRLKSLELQGFKSFPDRTVLNFDDGITIIIGPNGSGKSNISDAVRWVLGELSSKNIRGTKMEDVIFGGTDFRSQMNFAEVSLTIDNSSEDENRIPVDYDEVTVTRRYHRGGESEYMINRRPARLRDIVELFLNTGIGKTGYSIIGQGKIAEILSQKSEERRNIFEEAAGISKYRYKKVEAERKLSDVEANLLRVEDIRTELEGRIGPLEQDAKKAKQYLELYECRKRADVSLWLYDIAGTKSKVEKADRRYRLLKQELDIADDAISALETQSEKLFLLSQENKLKSETAGRKLREAREEKYRLESDSKVKENEISHILTQIKDFESSHAVSEQSLSDAKAKDATLRREKWELESSMEGCERTAEELKQQEAALEGGYEAIRDQIDAKKKEIEEHNARGVEAKLKLSSMEGSRGSSEERKEQINAELAVLREESAMMKKRVESAEGKIADYQKTKDETSAKLAEINEKLVGYQAELDGCTEKANDLKLELSSRRQRVDTMRRMEELFEGYQASVRFVMNNAERGNLSGIYGPVSKLISVASRYSTAIETALGAGIQNVVVANEDSAKAAMALLKAQNAGRATFYPLTSVKSQPLSISVDSLKQYKGYQGIASDLAEHDPKFDGVIGYMLGRTVVFDNIDNATVMAKATGYRVRAVTLDGQIINAGGSFTGGSVKKDTGMLTRASDIEKLEKEIKKLEVEYKLALDGAEAAKGSMEGDQRKSSDLSRTEKLLDSLISAESTQLQVLLAQVELSDGQIATLQGELDAFEEKESGLRSEYQILQAKADEADASEKQAQDELAALEKQSADQYLLLSENRDKQNGNQLHLAELRKDMEAKDTAIALSEDTVASITEQMKKQEQAVYLLQEKWTAEKNTVADHASKIEVLDADMAALEEEQKALAAESEQNDIREVELRNTIREKTKVREELFKDCTKAESACKLLLSEQDKLTEKLWEEYELTYTTAMALGYPAVTEETRAEAATEQTRYRNKLKALGPVNTGAIEEFQQVSERFAFITEQLNDLTKSKEDFARIITQLEQEMRTRFSQVFEDINFHFGRIFKELFGGGSAELKLTDPENILECGIEINVAPPGKIIKSLSLLSGGEQAFVAITLLFAILKVTPTPFCLLDEIEAALDDSNVRRFAEYLKNYSDNIQFIIITHRRGTMEAANTLYGVTMYERGISRVLSMNVDEAEKQLAKEE